MATLSLDQLQRILYAYHSDPFEVLGAHPVERNGQAGVAIRAFRPEARTVYVLRHDTGEQVEMTRLADEGFFEAIFAGRDFFPYAFELELYDGQRRQEDDPYRFPPVLSEFDLQLLGEGNHHHAHKRLGAQVIEHEGVPGTAFSVWAPHAQRVSIVGNFNGWDGRRHPMRARGSSGVWELFVPALGVGELYKYQLLTQDGRIIEKADPYGFASELRPNTASKIWRVDSYEWHDAEWMRQRPKRRWLEEPLTIYEVYLPAWARSPDNPDQYLNYRDLAHRLVDYVTEMGYTHIELLPVTEYPYDGSWGYQVIGYFAPTSRLGTPDDFQYFVDYCHRHNIGVLIDWVPAHFPKDAHGLARFDGTALYEHSDPRQGEHRDWGTFIFNYGRNEVRNFLISSALFWLERYHIDGLRVDAVASMLYLDYSRDPGDWVPNLYGGRENLEAIFFLRQLNELTHYYHPGILTVAEESTSFPAVTRPTYLGGMGFDFKWNMGWMNDTLAYIQKDPIYRKYEHNKLTFGLMYAFSETFILPISHDEVVHLKRSMAAKMPGDHWQQMANLRLYYGFMFTHPGKKLLFQGQDIGQWTEFSEDRSVDWHVMNHEPHRGINRWMRDLLHLVQEEPSLHEMDHSWEGFRWIDVNDWSHSIISYVRYAADPNDFLVVIHNFTPVVRHGYHIGVPAGGLYRELLNSDATVYWGSGVGNQGQVMATDQPWMNFPHSLHLTLPPLATLVLKPTRVPDKTLFLNEPEQVAEPATDEGTVPEWVENIHLTGEEPPEAEALPPAEEPEIPPPPAPEPEALPDAATVAEEPPASAEADDAPRALSGKTAPLPPRPDVFRLDDDELEDAEIYSPFDTDQDGHIEAHELPDITTPPPTLWDKFEESVTEPEVVPLADKTEPLTAPQQLALEEPAGRAEPDDAPRSLSGKTAPLPPRPDVFRLDDDELEDAEIYSPFDTDQDGHIEAHELPGITTPPPTLWDKFEESATEPEVVPLSDKTKPLTAPQQLALEEPPERAEADDAPRSLSGKTAPLPPRPPVLRLEDDELEDAEIYSPFDTDKDGHIEAHELPGIVTPPPTLWNKLRPGRPATPPPDDDSESAP